MAIDTWTLRVVLHTIAGKILRMNERERFRASIMLKSPLIRERFKTREANAARG
jgi:hypothetical protein